MAVIDELSFELARARGSSRRGNKSRTITGSKLHLTR